MTIRRNSPRSGFPKMLPPFSKTKELKLGHCHLPFVQQLVLFLVISTMCLSQTVTFVSDIPMSGTVAALYQRDYHSDFFFMTNPNTAIGNQ